MSERGPSTRVIRAAPPDAEQGEPFLPGPVFAAPFHLTGDPYTAPQSYTRYGNPTWDRYEEAVAALEGAQALLFSSGMAAARRGPAHASEARRRPRHGPRLLPRCARAHRAAPRATRHRVAARAARRRWRTRLEGAGLLRIESPSNPELEVSDLAALAAHGVTTVVDNTTAGALLQRPLDLGATYVLTSATKRCPGHADLMLGTSRRATPSASRRCACGGAPPGRSRARSRSGWRTARCATLAIRLERACDNALAVARLWPRATT